ncbi:MAG: PQQ-binding-like beta-propeller repeat protein, partial [Verrucomicrobiales bacterium]|nr:PQQ-binding-like beta-propeller repeat protein [Verrucomicrobiales bacterium]
RQVVMWNAKRLVGVEAQTGERLWAYEWAMRRTDQNTATPCYANGRFYLGGENRGMRSVGVRKSAAGWEVEERWRMNELALDMSSPVLVEGKLFGFSHYRRGKLFCQDAATGEVLWTAGDRIGKNVMFHAAGGSVVALVDGGELLVLEAAGEGFREVRRYDVEGGETWTPPVLLPDGVLVKGRERLVRLR